MRDAMYLHENHGQTQQSQAKLHMALYNMVHTAACHQHRMPRAKACLLNLLSTC